MQKNRAYDLRTDLQRKPGTRRTGSLLLFVYHTYAMYIYILLLHFCPCSLLNTLSLLRHLSARTLRLVELVERFGTIRNESPENLSKFGHSLSAWSLGHFFALCKRVQALPSELMSSSAELPNLSIFLATVIVPRLHSASLWTVS
jgi:hypothetical protein